MLQPDSYAGPKPARHLLLGIILLMLSAAVAPAAERIDLNGAWQFRVDPQNQGEAAGWSSQQPGGTETVRVPHTWNIGKYDDFEGTAWYFKTFELPESIRAQHVEIHFGATFYKSRVWLNGVELGTHEGGHTAYYFDATPHLRAKNFLAVEINNQPTTQTIPGWAMKLRDGGNVWYDWWHYGGIVRDVWLTANAPQLIRRQEIRIKVAGQAAEVQDRLLLENFAKRPVPVKVRLEALPPEGGAPVATASQTLTLSPGTQDATLRLEINPVRLWHFDQPNVYEMRAELEDSRGDPLDAVRDHFGARSIELRDRKFYLNSEPVRLSGMARHEDSPWEGLAETTGTIVHDYDDMKNLGMTLTRPVHYPQHPTVLDYCDRHGILLIPEIPMWQFSEKQMTDPKVIALARHMMQELIEQDFNHPSVWAWSTCNESATNTPGGMAYFKTMYDFIKSLDPDRYVSYADDQIAFTPDPAKNSASLADFIMWNQYFGSWHGPESLLPGVFEKIQSDYPGKTVIVSEFGLAAVFTPDTTSGDRLRSRIFRRQMAAFGPQEWIAGALMWCYQDYKSHRNLWPGQTEAEVDIGIVDENRQRRPSYKVWQELNSPAHLSLEWDYPKGEQPSGFHARIERRRPDEIPSYTLRGYRAEWEVRDDNGAKIAGGERTLPDVGPPQTLEGSWDLTKTKSLKLALRLYRPTGFVAAEKTLDWWYAGSGGLSVDDMKRQGVPAPE